MDKLPPSPFIFEQDRRFVLDQEAFLDAIEPVPSFLSAPRPEYLDAIALRPIVEVLAGHMR